jgi:hypothetical protein
MEEKQCSCWFDKLKGVLSAWSRLLQHNIKLLNSKLEQAFGGHGKHKVFHIKELSH